LVPHPYKSIAQLAQELGLTRDAVYKRIRSGKIDAAMIGCRFATNADPAKFVSIAQFAKALGVSRIAIYKRIKTGRLNAVRVGRNHLIAVDQITEARHSRLKQAKSRNFKQEKVQQALTTRQHFSVCELARELGLTRDAIYKKIKRGEIQASQVGRNFATRSQAQEHVSIAQLAAVLGISRIAVYKKVKKGQIQATRVGRNHLIEVKYVKKFLSAEQSNSLEDLLRRRKL